ncbi:hypothetical protein ACR2XN_28430, partial [Klebsiella pneumoniae]
YKLPKAHVCNQGICLPTSFILVRNINHRIILGNPFLHKLMPIQKIDSDGISTIIDGKEILFQFITDPQTRMIDQVDFWLRAFCLLR